MPTDDEIIEIRYSRTKNMFLFVGSITFVALSFWLLKIDISDFWNSFLRGVENQRKGWYLPAAILFFGLCCVFYARFIFDRRVQLRICKDGFFWRRWSNTTIPWTEIAGIKGNSSYRFGWLFIGLQLHHPENYKGHGLLGFLGAVNKLITGDDISLVTTNLENSKKDILVALQSAYKKYGT